MSSARDPTARLRAGLNPLLTASLGVSTYHGQASTPLSGVSMNSHNAFSSAQTPVSAMQPYNPQEWIASPMAPSERSYNSYQDPQSSPLPPPPYSPPRSQRPVSMSFDSPAAANTSATRAPPPEAPRPSPAPPVNQSFPPPPGTSGRGVSRERRFGLPSLGRRREQEQQTYSPPEAHPPSHPPIHAPAHPPSHPPAITSRQPHPHPLTLQIPQGPDPSGLQHIPPSSRRANSTPAVASPVSARSRSSSQVRWDTGMPLPPPPPGPPPSSSRSQSMSRPNQGSEPVMSPPTRRPPPSGVAALGPVPPTPADWVDTDSVQNREPSPERTSLVIDTASNSSSVAPDSAASASGASSAGGLARAHAMRSDKTLRERRAESRTRTGVRGSIDASIEGHSLSDIAIPPSSTGLGRRLTINRNTPRSGRSDANTTPRTAGTPQTGDTSSSAENSQESSSTPRAVPSAQTTPFQGTSTPPFSPQPRKAQPVTDGSQALAPKALPTPPPQHHRSASNSATRLTLETSNLSPVPPLTKQMVISQNGDEFSHGTIERFKQFARREAVARDDAERVRLFAEFIVSESRVRRERYAAAIGAMGSEIFDLTRDLFRPMAARRESTTSATSGVEFTPQSSEPSRSHRGSVGSNMQEAGPSQPSSAPTSAKIPVSPGGAPPADKQQWQSTNYMPSLSPILSMSQVSVDEDDSRGRPASRWWEAESEANSTKIERSKRESKYMGVPKEAREALQWIEDEPVASSSKRESSNEYPPEKTGWHDQEQVSTPQPLQLRHSLQFASSPNTPNPAHVDVSRLVTLPPPYPRHHPAVNNSHPELAQMRNSVRIISEMTELDEKKERFVQDSAKFRADAAEAAKQRKQDLRRNLQQEISSGNIGYAEAASIEADMKTDENARLKEVEKKDYESFQNEVVTPLSTILEERIQTATAVFEELRGRLFVETQAPNPNMPQEEGDEQPELLEKLTLLKWIFEARETLHRAIYDLLSDRNDRFREVVLTPYRLAGPDAAEKLANATAFFLEDGRKRALAFAEEVYRRTQEFRDVVEENVTRGVEVQLSAFWDIAPPLKRLLDKIPLDVEGFRIQIPASEFDENPSYVDHPMQYLFSLLLHAEKSTYQFIESQTNLLCLLHEVKEALMLAKAKLMEHDGRDEARVEEMRREEGERLTEDLKEKVRVVQDQWNDALGDCFGGCKERVGEWLLETGGWDESLEDGGVGGV